MNILFIVDALFKDCPGGSRLVAEKLGHYLVCRGHKVTILAPTSDKSKPSREKMGGVNIVRYYFNRDWRGMWFSLVFQSRHAFLELVGEEKFDLLHAHFAYTSLGPLLSSLARDLPCIRTFHGSWAEEALITEADGGKEKTKGNFLKGIKPSLRYFLCSRIEKFSLRHSEVVIVLSEYSRKEVIREYSVSPTKIRVIPGGVDAGKFQPSSDKCRVRKQLSLPQNTHILFTIRRLVPRMGLQNLVIAAKKVIRTHENVLFLIGGIGWLAPSLEALIRDYGMSGKIRLLGFISEERLPLYYQAADAFILPTIALEGFGLVTLEAISSGLPVLGTPVGATPEILSRIDKDLLLPGIAPSDLAEGIIRFLEHGNAVKYPPNKLRSFVLANYTWDKIVSQTELVYEEVLERNRSRS